MLYVYPNIDMFERQAQLCITFYAVRLLAAGYADLRVMQANNISHIHIYIHIYTYICIDTLRFWLAEFPTSTTSFYPVRCVICMLDTFHVRSRELCLCKAQCALYEHIHICVNTKWWLFGWFQSALLARSGRKMCIYVLWKK